MTKLRTLGRSNIEITPIGIGAWQFSEGKSFNGWFWDPLTTETTNQIIKRGIELGISWFDTAEAYGSGRSERGLAAGLKQLEITDEQIRIATKWWPLLRFASNIPKTIDKRISNLSPYSIDLYQIHQPYSFSFTKSEMMELAKLIDGGQIKTAGVSNFKANKMATAFEELEKLGHPLVSNQVKYSLVDRTIESNGILERAQELGITIIAYSPLEQGILTGKFHDRPELLDSRPFIRRWILKRRLDETRPLVELIQAIAEELDATPAQVSLSWLINYHQEVVAIPGASKPHHVDDSAGAMSISLSKEQMTAIEEKSQQFL